MDGRLVLSHSFVFKNNCAMTYLTNAGALEAIGGTTEQERSYLDLLCISWPRNTVFR